MSKSNPITAFRPEREIVIPLPCMGSLCGVKVALFDGQPCAHPGCASHRSHSCEGCGRVGARGIVFEMANKAQRKHRELRE